MYCRSYRTYNIIDVRDNEVITIMFYIGRERYLWPPIMRVKRIYLRVFNGCGSRSVSDVIAYVESCRDYNGCRDWAI